MQALDGNAIPDTLAAVFGTQATTAIGACASCGGRSSMSELAVYLGAPGAVARCRHCAAVVMVVVEARGVRCVDLQGLEALEPGA
jgi:hypothetical protein